MFICIIGSSGLVASLVSLIEHPTDDIRTLSVGWFFRVISCLLCVSLICFIIIIKSPTIQKLKRRPYSLTVNLHLLLEFSQNFL